MCQDCHSATEPSDAQLIAKAVAPRGRLLAQAPVEGAVKQAEIPQELNFLDMSTAELQDVVYALADRIDPVLRKQPLSNGQDQTAPEFATDLGGAIAMQRYRVAGIVEVLYQIKSRVEF